jgi:hypothetical protein
VPSPAAAPKKRVRGCGMTAAELTEDSMRQRGFAPGWI